MAGDWIKMRSALVTSPKVIRMARFLAENRGFINWFTRGTNVTCDGTVYELCDVTVVKRVTVGSLLAVWSSVNGCANQDGFLKGISLSDVDEMAGVPGFGRAMELVGWLEEHEDGVVFVNFSEHNTVEKERSTGAKTGAERTKEWREKKKKAPPVTSDVTVTSQRDHREDKNREDIKDTPIPPDGGKPSRKRPAVSLQIFLDDCKAAGVKPIPEGSSVFAYAEQSGIPQDFLRLQWLEFKDRYADGTKRYKDWPTVFGKSVRGNWFRLWYADGADGSYKLTTTGIQAENTHRDKK